MSENRSSYDRLNTRDFFFFVTRHHSTLAYWTSRVKRSILVPFAQSFDESKKNEDDSNVDNHSEGGVETSASELLSTQPADHSVHIIPTLPKSQSNSYRISIFKKSQLQNWTMRSVLKLCAVVSASVALLFVGFFAPFISRANSIPVRGSTSSYTIVFLSYTPRLRVLQGAVRHYSRCPSASSVVVVWNSGPPPDPHTLPSAVPLRVRQESINSLNNRFKPDPLITTRAVLSIDDDLRIPCRDIEEAFALWRNGSYSIVGFFPRLIENDLVFRGEGYAVKEKRYNAVLTGAAFIDASVAFTLYWSNAVASARAVVDQVFNGEDLLMNFVLSNGSATSPETVGGLRYYRPSRRIDISKLSGVGISHNMEKFKEAASIYLRAFVSIFKGFPLRDLDMNVALDGKSPPLFCGTALGCLYI